MPERAPVQKSTYGPAGTIAWDEHVTAWNAYATRYKNGQSAERIAERGGFGHGELLAFLGHPPKTFEARNPAADAENRRDSA